MSRVVGHGTHLGIDLVNKLQVLVNLLELFPSLICRSNRRSCRPGHAMLRHTISLELNDTTDNCDSYTGHIQEV
jgi:hypothetical protein